MLDLHRKSSWQNAIRILVEICRIHKKILKNFLWEFHLEKQIAFSVEANVSNTFFLSDANSVVLVSQMLGSTPIESCKTTIDTSMILQATIWLTEMNRWNKIYRLNGQVYLKFGGVNPLFCNFGVGDALFSIKWSTISSLH